MEFFGLTRFGYRETIKEMMKPGYKDPVKIDICIDFDAKENKSKRATDCIKNIDIDTENVNGYAYCSSDRLMKMRKKAMWKPVGPTEMYRAPLTDAQKFGFWTKDPALEDELWYFPDVRYPRIFAPTTSFCDFAMRVDKMFRM